VLDYRPLFNVGDFVQCSYERYPMLGFYEDEFFEYAEPIFYGIIVYVDYGFEDLLDEFIYEVLCTDGEKRYFLETELKNV